MEIDIVEHLTEWGAGKYHYAAHWDGYKDQLKSIGAAYKLKNDNDYHRFGLYWNEGILIWYLDGAEIDRLKSKRVSNVPMYVIFNTAMGGWATNKIDKKSLPDTTAIDYLRVWSGTVPERKQKIYSWQHPNISLEGKWKKENDYIHDKRYWARKKRELSLTLKPKIEEAGTYAVYAKWPEHKKTSSRSSFVVAHAKGMDQVIVNQTENANYWYKLGEFDFDTGDDVDQYVLLENKNADACVILSELKFELLSKI